MDTSTTIRAKGQIRRVPLQQLHLDTFNPRLSPDDQGGSQDDLAVSLDLAFQALTVAESIASHGYFESEPLIAVEEDGKLVVVEGNRRLTALLGLADSRLRSHLANRDQWEVLAARANLKLDDLVPVVVVADRAEATPIIGFRHISGILQWEPFAQARYIARLVDEEEMTPVEIALMIGIDRTRVGNLYRDQAIVAQAHSLGIETGHVERAFSLMTVAMSTPRLREHIGAQLGSRTEAGTPPLPDEKEHELKELITWLYGDGEKEPVISESRDISRLGNVVSHAVGLDALRKGETLDTALQRVKDSDDNPRQRLVNRLRTGRKTLSSALEDMPDFTDDVEVRELVDEARAAADALLATLEVGAR